MRVSERSKERERDGSDRKAERPDRLIVGYDLIVVYVAVIDECSHASPPFPNKQKRKLDESRKYSGKRTELAHAASEWGSTSVG